MNTGPTTMDPAVIWIPPRIESPYYVLYFWRCLDVHADSCFVLAPTHPWGKRRSLVALRCLTVVRPSTASYSLVTAHWISYRLPTITQHQGALGCLVAKLHVTHSFCLCVYEIRQNSVITVVYRGSPCAIRVNPYYWDVRAVRSMAKVEPFLFRLCVASVSCHILPTRLLQGL